MKQGNGMIMCFSLKNPSYPEYIATTESGVMCIDINGDDSYKIACGFYDGSVGVFYVSLTV